MGENFTSYISDKELVPRIYKQLKNLSSKKTTKNWDTEINNSHEMTEILF